MGAGNYLPSGVGLPKLEPPIVVRVFAYFLIRSKSTLLAVHISTLSRSLAISSRLDTSFSCKSNEFSTLLPILDGKNDVNSHLNQPPVIKSTDLPSNLPALSKNGLSDIFCCNFCTLSAILFTSSRVLAHFEYCSSNCLSVSSANCDLNASFAPFLTFSYCWADTLVSGSCVALLNALSQNSLEYILSISFISFSLSLHCSNSDFVFFIIA